MKILLVHNFYRESGGEDAVFKAEEELLCKNCHTVERMVFDNATIHSVFDKIRTGIRMFYNPVSARAIKERIEIFRPDIIHLHNFILLASPSILYIANAYGIPVVHTLHNYRLICPSATLFYNNKIYEKSLQSAFAFDAVLKGVYRNSRIQTALMALMVSLHRILGTWKNKIALYIALTEFARNKFLESSLNIPKDKIVVKPNFVADQGTGIKQRKNYFLFVGRLAEEKGIRVLLEAAKTTACPLVIIGTGPLVKWVQQYALENQNISYLGFLEKPRILGYMKECQALIFPSIWYEGCPMTILEAFSTGTPVIASRLGGMKEIVEDHYNGLHFETGNASDLGTRILELIQDVGLAKSLGDHARQTYLSRYSPDKNYNLLLGIYYRAIETMHENARDPLHQPVSLSHSGLPQ